MLVQIRESRIVTAAPGPCDPYLDLGAFKHPLPYLKEALKRQHKIKIVAIGSSSTVGEGDVILSRIGWSWLCGPQDVSK